jgi:hypothetical protein
MRRQPVKPPDYAPPSYPEYAGLFAAARAAERADGGFVDPAKVRRIRALPRAWTWRVSVLGHPLSPTYTDWHLLLLAHDADLDPPPPAWLVEQQQAAADRQAELDAQRAARRVRDQQVWDEARAANPALVELLHVRYNTRGGGRRAFQGGGQLAHVTPAVDMWSGSAGRPRLHAASRALCETAGRWMPLELSDEPVDAPATCARCLRWIAQVRI